MGQRILLHVDLDAFFASVEQIALDIDASIPLIIGSDPLEGRGRGIVSTCNYAARNFGIRSAMPISEAWKRCPGNPHGSAIYQQPRFTIYRRASNRVMKILKINSDRFEQVSIDEAVLDITLVCKSDYDLALAFAKNKQSLILEKTGLSASIGIGSTRVLSKIASNLNKPSGLTLIDSNRIGSSIDELPLDMIPSIGPKASTRLAEFDLIKIGDARNSGSSILEEALGELRGEWLWRAIEGETNAEVSAIKTRKSIGKEKTFRYDVSNDLVIYDTLEILSKDVHGRLKLLNAEAKTIEVKIRYQGFETIVHSRTLLVATSHFRPIMNVAKKLVSDIFSSKRPVRLIGIRLSNFQSCDNTQALLFEEE